MWARGLGDPRETTPILAFLAVRILTLGTPAPNLQPPLGVGGAHRVYRRQQSLKGSCVQPHLPFTEVTPLLWGQLLGS